MILGFLVIGWLAQEFIVALGLVVLPSTVAGADFACTLIIRHLEFQWTPENVRAMMYLPDAGDQFPVGLNLPVGRLDTHTDRGIVTFSEALLHFEDKRVSFDLPIALVQHR